ncbi:pentapeptide repeat-containing protein [Amphibacillus sediminis]|uniref:pentapeptide repeat-containing protein n=1 Tax=Amphibacillus sediminis TaxID=360185 RepID=UPI000831F657|nr:pentapeptide repeat-containing protein [Amphibacillus sediminis]
MSKILKPNLSTIERISDFESVYCVENPIIEDVIIEDCSIGKEVEKGLEIRDAILRRVNLDGFSCEKLYLRNVRFEKCFLTNAQLEEITMDRVEFINCQLTGVLMPDSRLNHVWFSNCNMQLVGMGYSQQKNVHYQECLLRQADFYLNQWKNVVLNQCDLTGANLAQTKLAGIDISRSSFDNITIGIDDLKGCIVNEEQARAFSRLLGLVVRSD